MRPTGTFSDAVEWEQFGIWKRFDADCDIWKPFLKAGTEEVSRLGKLRLLYNYMGLRATLLYRISHGLWKVRVPILPGVVSRLNLTLHGLDVPASTPIGPGLYVPHPVGTVISARKIGTNVSIIASVTIGMRNEPAFPTIGNGVFIGAGARVLGGISVGDRAVIGANAVVITGVPEGATAVGVPARIIEAKAAPAPSVEAN